jgi:Rps23 Pro-64 3,4-dihydroxylase Tpa1-like proline 4-hydroxylase
MSTSASVQTRDRLVPLDTWQEQLPNLARQYRENSPYPHIHLSNFLAEDTIRQAAREFPGPGDTTWIQYKHFNENKLGKTDRAAFPPLIGRIIDELNTPEFIAWLSQLTGIPDLMADPSLEGGGMHQTERGGFLNLHTDFSHHHHQPTWRRRCNLILYLNPDWDLAWGGAIEFWRKEMKECAAKYPPLLNHAVIFSTTDESIHGYPDPISCPPEVTRKSIALYYYTVDPAGAAPRSTNYRARPGDGARAALIWLDNKLLAGYSWAKRTLGLSDAFASKVLGFFGRKKK